MKEVLGCYLLFSLNRIRSFFDFMSIFFVVPFVVLLISYGITQHCMTDEHCTVWGVFKGFDFSFWLIFNVIGTIFTVIPQVVLPSNKEASLMLATYLAITNKDIQKLPSKLLNKINEYLEYEKPKTKD